MYTRSCAEGRRALGRALIAACLLAPTLPAATVQSYFNGVLFSSTIQRTVDNGANWFTTEGGIFSFTRTGGDYPGFQATGFYGFCIEPREFVTPGTTYDYIWAGLEQGATNIGGMGVTRADLLRELFGRYYPNFSVLPTATEARALQFAVWEVVRETSGTLDVYNGTTRYRSPADAAALALAQTYVQSLNGTGPMRGDLFALILTGGVQDIVVEEMPEPAQLTLAGLAMLALAGALKRYRATR